MLFKDKVALVTGGASGIGRAAALAFAREGAQVAVADIAEEGGNQTVEAIEREGGHALFCRADMLVHDEVRAMVETAVARFGRLDCALNNVGHPGNSTDVVNCTESEWDTVMGLNVRSVWWCMKYEIPEMLKGGGGAIVNVSSGAGLFAAPLMAAYTTSKHAVVGLTRSAAIDFGPRNIRVNVLHPGPTATPMLLNTAEALVAKGVNVVQELEARNPLRRLGTPEELAEAAIWLCSSSASFTNGASLVCDGGLAAQR